MVVDVTFAKTAPKMYSAVGYATQTKGHWQTFVHGEGCTGTEQPADKYCLPEDANTNALFGVCKEWQCTCTAATCGSFNVCNKYEPSMNACSALTDICGAFAPFTKPAIGDVGDEVGVMIWNKSATKKIPGIRIGRRVVSNTNCIQIAKNPK